MENRTVLAIGLCWLAPLAFQAVPQPNSSAKIAGKIADLKIKVDDLVFRVDDMGGKVQSLEVKESATEVRIELAADVLFEFDKADILPKAADTLAKAAQFVRDKAHGTTRIAGYTDAKGSAPYNQKLSERRAESVKAWFIAKENLRNVKFETQGFGAGNPVAPNTKPDGSDDPEGRRKNRRVEIVIRK